MPKKPVKQLQLVYFLCPVCGTLKSTPLAWAKKAKNPTCSPKCKGVLNGQRWAKHGHKGRAAWSAETEARFKERMSGTKNPNWRGGRTTANGYVMVRKPDHPRAGKKGYVYEHILVMEQKLGRLTKRGEVVHHIDGNPKNNAPENLELYQSNRQHLEKAHGYYAKPAASR